MIKSNNRYHLGQIVQVIQGRETGSFAIVVGMEADRYVWLADGKRRKIGAPKRKNIRHLQPTKQIADIVADQLTAGRRVMDIHLRHALNQHMLRQEHKGE